MWEHHGQAVLNREKRKDALVVKAQAHDLEDMHSISFS